MLNNDVLCRLICYVPQESLKEEAWKHLIKQNPTNDDLLYIIGEATSIKWRAKTQKALDRA